MWVFYEQVHLNARNEVLNIINTRYQGSLEQYFILNITNGVVRCNRVSTIVSMNRLTKTSY